MDSDEIRRLKDQMERVQNEARKLLEGPVRLAQEQIDSMGGFTKMAADAQLIIDQVGTPLTSEIERALGTLKLPDEDLALLTGHNSTFSALEESAKLLLAQEQIEAMGGFTKMAADAQLIVDQVGSPLTSGIERALALGTVKLPDEDLALLTGNHSAFTALEESATLLTGEHASFGILEDRAKLLQGIGIESTLSNYGKLTTDITFPVITSHVHRMLDEVKFNVGSVGDSILKIFGSIDVPNDVASLMQKNSAAVEQAMKGISSSLNPEIWEAFGFPALTDAAKFNEVLVNSLSAPAWTSVPNFDELLEDALSGLSGSYADIFSSLAKEVEIFPRVPDFVVTLPPRDMVIKTEIIASRSCVFRSIVNTHSVST